MMRLRRSVEDSPPGLIAEATEAEEEQSSM